MKATARLTPFHNKKLIFDSCTTDLSRTFDTAITKYILQSVRPSSVNSEVRLIITVTWVYCESEMCLTDSYENVMIIVSEETKAANQIFVKIDLREG